MQDTTKKIPVYVSRPSTTPAQAASVELLRRWSEDSGLEWMELEQAHFSFDKPPLEQVLDVIQKCYGGLILGFEHSRSESLVARRGDTSKAVSTSQVVASPWRQIEAAVLLARNLPVLIFKDRDVTEGLFDPTSGHLVVDLPTQTDDRWTEVFANWVKKVREHHDTVNSKFDVFLSFSGEDESPAREAFEFLASQGLRVFFSRESIPQLGQADYMKAINTALDRARHMIVVSSSAEGFAKPWVEREWSMFLNEKLSGRKSGNIVVVPAAQVPVAQLPIALRSQQVVPLSGKGLLEMRKFLSTDRNRGLA